MGNNIPGVGAHVHSLMFLSCSSQRIMNITSFCFERYIEDSNPDTGEAAREASPSVVVQAVETCFIGKKFIFGVKDSEKQNGTGHLQDNSRVGHCPKALTACQMFTPNPGLVGCTVFRYLRDHRCSASPKGSHGGSPESLFAALDLPSSELSGLPDSGDRDAVPSTHTHCLSSLWPQSFGLTSSSISGGTAADPETLELSRSACDDQKGDDSPVPLPHHSQSINNSQDANLTASNRNVQDNDEFGLCPTWHNSIFVTKDTQSHSSGRDDDRALPNALEVGRKDCPGTISIPPSRGEEKSQSPWQGYSFDPFVSCAGHSRDGQSSRGDQRGWEELPSSESLDEFIARMENGDPMVSPAETRAWECFLSKGAGEIHGLVNQSPPQLDATSTTGPAHEKPQEVAEKADASREPMLSCHQSDQRSLSGKEHPQAASFRPLSARRKDRWEHLSDHRQVLLLQLSPPGIKPSHLKVSRLSSKERVNRDSDGQGSHPAPSSLKAARHCLRSPTQLNRECENDVAGWKTEGSSCCEPKQAAGQESEKAREGQPLPEVHGNHCKGGEISSLLQDSSPCPQGCYNASADLFDVSTAGAEIIMGTFSAQGSVLTAKLPALGCQPRELEASWNTSQNGLSLLDLFAASDPKASTPVACSALELECNPASSRDFVPSSQSTPRVQPCQQARLPLDAKGKRPRPTFRGPFIKQLVSQFLQSRRTSGGSSTARNASRTRDFCINGSPTQVLSENGGAEWIPPSEKKHRQPLLIQNQNRFRSRTSWGTTEKIPASGSGTRWEIPRGTIGLTRTEFSPQNQQPPEVSGNAADPLQVAVASPGLCPFSGGGRPNLSSTPRSTPGPVNWSLELFGDNSQLLPTEAAL
ncbi:DNA damage-induced apoptosis suppressor protein isoform X2 [Paroedura picta]|uniref:DNA damage-induced apoptosis suppressor protein isoform X2 n=1 Tax=Paroedura picta TaxID=143630 RepID=UPI0040578BD3